MEKFFFHYRARLLRVHDGDTLTLELDQGMSDRSEEAIRLLNVWAPELRQLGGEETMIFVQQWLDRNCNQSLRWPLYVKTLPNKQPEPDEIRTFVRYVGTVWRFDLQGNVVEPSLNNDVNDFLLQHPEWPHGIGQ